MNPIIKEVNVMELVYGALILASMICMAALVITDIRMKNDYLAQKEVRKSGPWDWE